MNIMNESELLGKFWLCARNAVEEVILRMAKPDRLVGYFCVARSNGTVINEGLIGVIANREKADKYYILAQEKALRLGGSPHDISSAQTRDPEISRYAGAIRVDDNWIFSFSGFSEEWDEVAMIRTALKASTHGLISFSPDRENAIYDAFQSRELMKLLDKSFSS